MKFELTKMDMSKIRPHAIHLFQARRNSGKSVLMRYILYEIRHMIDATVVFCPTKSTADMFRGLIPREFIYQEASLDALERILKFQRERVRIGKGRSLCIVLDDCAFDKKFWRSPQIAFITQNGRHCLITCLITSQHCTSLGPDIRGNCDYIYAFKTSIIADRRRLYDCFFGCVSWTHFMPVFEAATSHYGALVCNQTETSTDPTKILSYTRATLNLPPFILCNAVYFKISTQQRLKRTQERENQTSDLAVSVITGR